MRARRAAAASTSELTRVPRCVVGIALVGAPDAAVEVVSVDRYGAA